MKCVSDIGEEILIMVKH